MDKRLLALDQSSKVSGWALFVNGKLEKYGKWDFKDEDTFYRIYLLQNEVRKLIEEEQVTHVAFEDIQLQTSTTNNVKTFKVLAHVQSAIAILCIEKGLPYDIVPSSTWKSAVGVKGRGRTEQKQQAQALVLERYGAKVIQDIADAICLGASVVGQTSGRIDWE